MRPDAGLRKKISFSTMPCVSRLVNGSVERREPEVAHHPRPEARVEQVQDRVLDAADVLVHRHPVRSALVDHRRVVAGAGVAEEVPGRVHEGVHRVGLAPRRAAALRAGAVEERFAPARAGCRCRRARGPRAAPPATARPAPAARRSRAVDQRDRAAPVALARDAPVAQAPVHAALAGALRLEELGDRRRRLPRTRGRRSARS